MAYTLEPYDLRLLDQLSIILYLRLEIKNDDDSVMDYLDGMMVGGQISVAADSSVRRTCSVTIVPIQDGITLTNRIKGRETVFNLTERSLVWINKTAMLYGGIQDVRTKEIRWYRLGSFVFTDQSITYDSVTNQMAINCSDFMSKLDGTVNGTIGQLTTHIGVNKPIDDEDPLFYCDFVESKVIEKLERVEEEDVINHYTVYAVTLDSVEGYQSGQKFAMKIPANNTAEHKLMMNNFTPIDICALNSETPLAANTLQAGKIYTFRFKLIVPPESEEDNSDQNQYYICQLVGEYTGPMTTKFGGHPNNQYNYIDATMMSILSQLGGVNNYIINPIGEINGVVGTAEENAAYRAANPLWDALPYDLDFSAGCSVFDMLSSLSGLYPNYEIFFDEYGTFIEQLIPSCYNDNIYIGDEILQKYLISENTQRDLSVVRNVCEVWAPELETDFYQDTDVVQENGVYKANIDGYVVSYMSGDKVALKVPADNVQSQKININNFGDVIVYDEVTEKPLEAGRIKSGHVAVFKFRKQYVGQQDKLTCYYLGAFQPHAMCVITDGTVVKDGWTDPDTGTKYDLYSKEYFQKKHGCDNVEMWVIPDSPFTVQKIGVRLFVGTGGEYDSCSSDSAAIARAHYDAWVHARLTDNITITTLIMPWLDVNKKVTYTMANSDVQKQYIIKSVAHDFTGATSSITMMTFYPLYEEAGPVM